VIPVDTRGRTIFFGVLLGAATGLVAAMLLNRRALRDERSTAITTGEGLKLGVLVFGLLRAIMSLGDDEKSR
jgi:gas vesicle protein